LSGFDFFPDDFDFPDTDDRPDAFEDFPDAFDLVTFDLNAAEDFFDDFVFTLTPSWKPPRCFDIFRPLCGCC
jgi:hypothetical protein